MTNINEPSSFAVKSSGDQKITAWWQTPPRTVLSAGQAALRSLSFTNIPLIIYFPAVICSTCFGFKYKLKIIPEKPSEMCKHDVWHKYKSGNHFSRKLCAVWRRDGHGFSPPARQMQTSLQTLKIFPHTDIFNRRWLGPGAGTTQLAWGKWSFF